MSLIRIQHVHIVPAKLAGALLWGQMHCPWRVGQHSAFWLYVWQHLALLWLGAKAIALLPYPLPKVEHVCVQVDAEVGAPRVNYRETITKRANFDYLHKKQSGGQGQYGRVVGYIEPLPEGSAEKFEYANEIVGNAIPPNYLPSCKKGFEEAINSGTVPSLV